MEGANFEPALVKKSELAKVFSVSPRTMDNSVAQRLIPYLAPSPRMHLFDVSAVKKAFAAPIHSHAIHPSAGLNKPAQTQRFTNNPEKRDFIAGKGREPVGLAPSPSLADTAAVPPPSEKTGVVFWAGRTHFTIAPGNDFLGSGAYWLSTPPS